jgi:hypothetical protein
MRSRDFTHTADTTNLTSESIGGAMKSNGSAVRWGRPERWNAAREWCADLLRVATALGILALLAAMDGRLGS